MIQAAQTPLPNMIIGVLGTKRWSFFRKRPGSVNLDSEVMATVRIVIADDHTLIRSGLRTLLGHEPSFQVVAEASKGIEAVDVAQREQVPSWISGCRR